MNNVLNELLVGELLVILLAVALLIIVWLTLSMVIRRASKSGQSVAAVMTRGPTLLGETHLSRQRAW